jgi:predicted aldo/keto reductase-like oxidoreductase
MRGENKMIYKEFQDLKLSTLGMGAMRLPVIDGVYSNINQKETEKMVAYAMEQGINYYDTAWAYHDGQSEIAMAKALSKYPRESYYLANKFPGYDLSNIGKVETIFEQQLKKCGVEYFDFYLFHNVCEINIDAYLDPKYGIFEYLMKQKENGRIRHLGFSAHGSYEVMKRFLEAYGEKMEFGQIQLNYLDWSFQDAKAKVELLEQYHLPIWVMEPLRGGSLCKLLQEYEGRLTTLRQDEKIPAWAFRFLTSIPSVKVVLSGMSNYEQLVENIQTFEQDKSLNTEETEVLLGIAADMLKKKILPCTACRYCTKHCPKQLDIPELLALYNEHNFTEGGFIAPMAVMALSEDKKPSACVGCRSCEKVCPQQIKISEAMTDFVQKINIK